MKKGDLGSTIIMWIAVLSVAIIVSTWFASNISPLQAESKILDHDLTKIFNTVERACSSSFFQSTYIPQSTKGVVTFNESEVCIEFVSVSNCRVLTCEVEEFFAANLSDIMSLSFFKNEGGLIVEGVALD